MIDAANGMTTPWSEHLPDDEPAQALTPDGDAAAGAVLPAPEQLLSCYEALVRARRFDEQATALTRQGRLAVYPSSRGQEASQVGAVLASAERDWMFPTYRESAALVTRGVPVAEVLSLLRGEWHCGYDPYVHRSAPQCTPLATQALHAVGFAHAARSRGEDVACLAFLGDGATSEGDTHEALNFAAVLGAPVVFFVQNNGYAISVPLARQTRARSLAHRGVGYGLPGRIVDGNDVVAVRAVVGSALDHARAGGGPVLVEAVTYRVDAHTNADDASRYRPEGELDRWLARDPVERLRRYLRGAGLLDDAAEDAVRAGAEELAAATREAMNTDPAVVAEDLFAHVYAEPTPALQRQRAAVLADLAAADPGLAS